MLTVVSVLTCGRSLNSKHHLAEKICETCATLNHSNFQFEAEPEAVEKKLKDKRTEKKSLGNLISIHSFFCQIHCRVLKLNVSCCSIGTVTDADNGNNSFHQMVIFWPPPH